MSLDDSTAPESAATSASPEKRSGLAGKVPLLVGLALLLVVGLIGFPTQSAYCASKFAVRGYTESLRHELRDTGVRSVCVHPGGIKTHIVDNARFRSDDRGGTDHAQFAADFQKAARTSPEKAAETIHRGLEKGKDRILIGADAGAISLVTRLMPVRYYDLFKRLEPLLRP